MSVLKMVPKMIRVRLCKKGLALPDDRVISLPQESLTPKGLAMLNWRVYEPSLKSGMVLVVRGLERPVELHVLKGDYGYVWLKGEKQFEFHQFCQAPKMNRALKT